MESGGGGGGGGGVWGEKKSFFFSFFVFLKMRIMIKLVFFVCFCGLFFDEEIGKNK